MPKTSAKILGGKKIREQYTETLRRQIDVSRKKMGARFAPKLATIQIGESKDVDLYNQCLTRLFARFEIELLSKKFPDVKALRDDSYRQVFEVYRDKSVTGVLVFSPMPDSVSAETIFYNLPTAKDVEGRTYMKRAPFGVFSPTANAVMAILEDEKIKLPGIKAVVVGHSDSVGKPIAISLLDKGSTVTVCHKETVNLSEEIAPADLVVTAAGKPNLIKGAWIKPGAVVIDVGENVVNGTVVGDVEFEAAAQRASAITPVPGGVGPLTSLMLVKNLFRLFEDKMNHGND